MENLIQEVLDKVAELKGQNINNENVELGEEELSILLIASLMEEEQHGSSGS